MAEATESIQSGLYLTNIAISSEDFVNKSISKIPIRCNQRNAQKSETQITAEKVSEYRAQVRCTKMDTSDFRQENVIIGNV